MRRSNLTVIITAIALLFIAASQLSAEKQSRLGPLQSNYMDTHRLLVPEVVTQLDMDDEQAFWFKSAMYHHLIGVQYFYDKEYGYAIKHLTMANNMSPDNPVILMRLARAFKKVGKEKRASQYLQRAYNIKAELKGLGGKS